MIPKMLAGPQDRHIPAGHKTSCNCQICGTLWLLEQNGEKGIKNIRIFFETGEMR